MRYSWPPHNTTYGSECHTRQTLPSKLRPEKCLSRLTLAYEPKLGSRRGRSGAPPSPSRGGEGCTDDRRGSKVLCLLVSLGLKGVSTSLFSFFVLVFYHVGFVLSCLPFWVPDPGRWQIRKTLTTRGFSSAIAP